MIILRILIFTLILVNSYFLILKINTIFSKNILIARGELGKRKSNRSATYIKQNILEKDYLFNILEKKKKKIKRQGNPYKLTLTSYYLFKIVPAISVAILLITLRMVDLTSLAIVIFVYNLIDLLYYLANKQENIKIRKDLPNIYDILDIQSFAGINIGIALTEVFAMAESKRLKEDLMELSAEINLTKNVEQSLDKFIEKYDLIELESFVLGVKQSLESGRNREIFANQSEILKENNLLDISEKTKQINIWIGLVGFLIFIGVLGITGLAFKDIIGNGFKSIL